MKAFLVALAVSALAYLAVADDPTVTLPGVSDLTPDNFDKIVKGDKHALVEFYAPWCGHCKRMVGEYKTLGEMVQSDPALKGRVVVAKVNADEHRSLGERFGVSGFPTIKYFPRGKAVNKDNAEAYNGARTSDQFLDFLKKKLEEDKGFARVEELDTLVKDFVGADKKAKGKTIKAVEKAVGSLKDDAKKTGELYVKAMKKALEKGDDYFGKERARLERMISSGGVAASKVDDFARKSSVLSAFVAETAEE
jgi:protein disulfide-isomerase A6